MNINNMAMNILKNDCAVPIIIEIGTFKECLLGGHWLIKRNLRCHSWISRSTYMTIV